MKIQDDVVVAAKEIDDKTESMVAKGRWSK
jgi:hypothetical protein